MLRPCLAILVDLAALVEEQLGLLDILPPHSILCTIPHIEASCIYAVSCGKSHQSTVLCALQPPCTCLRTHPWLLAAGMTPIRSYCIVSGGVYLQGGALEPVKRIDI